MKATASQGDFRGAGVSAGVSENQSSSPATHTLKSLFSTVDQSRRAPLLGAILVGMIAILLGWSRLHFRPEMSFTASFVNGEFGNQLWRGDRILHGQFPYRDFALQYGFIPSYLYAGFAFLFGNTLITNLWFHLTCSAGCLILIYQLLQRSIGTLRSFLYTLAFIPYLLVPGGTMGSFTNNEGISVERLCFLSILVLWSTPDRRTFPRAVAIGLGLGLWQEIKFGGAIFGGLSVVIVDVAWLLCHHPTRESCVFWLRRILAMAATFFAIEALWVAMIFALTPRALALDAVWPSYIAQAYHRIPGGGSRPDWTSVAFLVTQQWLPLSCGLMCLAALVLNVRRSPERIAWPLVIGWTFYVTASPIYFGHVFLWYQYVWTLLPAGAWGITCLPKWGKRAVLLSWVPASLLMLKMTYVNHGDPTLKTLTLPNSEIVFVDSKYAREMGALQLAAQQATSRGHFVFGLFHWGGGGFHFFYDRNFGLRNYMMDECIFRPSDRVELERKLDLVEAIGPIRPDESNRFFDTVLGRQLGAQIRANYTLVRPSEDALQILIKSSTLQGKP